MTRRTIIAALAAAGLALGAGACGSGDREQVERSNPGQEVPEGSPGTVEKNPSGLTPTGETQPTVTQPEGGG